MSVQSAVSDIESNANKKVIVGMSGGVDSSVSAYLLQQQGYQVEGLFMKNWEEEDESGACIAEKDAEDARAVCDLLGVPFYSVNFAKEYWENVFTHFLKELEHGHTHDGHSHGH